MRLGKSYKQTVLWSIGFAVVFTVAGLFAAYYGGLKPGGAIVLTGVLCLALLLLFRRPPALGAGRRGGSLGGGTKREPDLEQDLERELKPGLEPEPERTLER
jgi:hypothetical protein